MNKVNISFKNGDIQEGIKVPGSIIYLGKEKEFFLGGDEKNGIKPIVLKADDILVMTINKEEIE